jgi:hypothetical protein
VVRDDDEGRDDEECREGADRAGVGPPSTRDWHRFI